MKLAINAAPLYTYTILHLSGWIESLDILSDTDEWPFDTLEELAMQLEVWRDEFQRINSGVIASEPVLVSLYGDEIILVCNQATGEFFTLNLSTSCIPTTLIS